MRLKKQYQQKYYLNKANNITKIHKQNNAKNKQVSMIVNLLCKNINK